MADRMSATMVKLTAATSARAQAAAQCQANEARTCVAFQRAISPLGSGSLTVRVVAHQNGSPTSTIAQKPAMTRLRSVRAASESASSMIASRAGESGGVGGIDTASRGSTALAWSRETSGASTLSSSGAGRRLDGPATGSALILRVD